MTPCEVSYIADESGHEFLFRPQQARSALHDRFVLPDPGIMSEIRLLARSGSARFVVTSNPSSLGHEILPHLPLLLLDPSWRSIYINADEDRSPAYDAGIRWELHIKREEGDHLEWSLEPLHS